MNKILNQLTKKVLARLFVQAGNKKLEIYYYSDALGKNLVGDSTTLDIEGEFSSIEDGVGYAKKQAQKHKNVKSILVRLIDGPIISASKIIKVN